MESILILTSSGGGGLLQAANAKEQELSSFHVVKVDVLKSWLWKWVGSFCFGLWNRAQVQGKVWALSLMGRYQVLMDYFLGPAFFVQMLRTLFRYRPQRVVDTQVLCTNALVKAIRCYNYFTKSNISLEKVIVDIPSKKAGHFFRGIRSLGKSARKSIVLSTMTPLLEEEETEEQFWKKHTKLTMEKIRYDIAVRKSFAPYFGKPKIEEKITISFQVDKQQQLTELTKLAQKDPYLLQNSAGSFIELKPNDLLMTVLLGSQPSFQGTKGYVEAVIEQLKLYPLKEGHFYVCVCCANVKVLFKEIYDSVIATKLPTTLSIIPLTFQPEEVIAKLFYRSDITCTRSGGQTALELIKVATGKVWVHSEAEAESCTEKLLKGIPGWEAEAARYMVQKIGAKIMTPKLAKKEIVTVIHSSYPSNSA